MQNVGTVSSARTRTDIKKVVHGISLPMLKYSSLRKCIRLSFPLSLIFLGSGLCLLSNILNMAFQKLHLLPYEKHCKINFLQC